MKIHCEASFPKIGVNDQVEQAVKTGNLAIRLGFTDNDNNSRFETCLSVEQAIALMDAISDSLHSIDEFRKFNEHRSNKSIN